MVEKGTMTATFEPTLEGRKLLEGKPTEYVVVNPVAVEAEFENGRVVRYPQEIRERVVRCRDCKHAITSYRDGLPRCAGPLVMEATLVSPDGFCAWGEPMEEDS